MSQCFFAMHKIYEASQSLTRENPRETIGSNQEQNLATRWALITGASAGFGKAIAEKLASEGVNLFICARRAERLQELKSQLERSHGIKVVPLVFDISKKDQCKGAIESAQGIDQVEILVNNA